MKKLWNNLELLLCCAIRQIGGFDRLMRQVDGLAEDVHVAAGVMKSHAIFGCNDIPELLRFSDQFA